MKKRVFLLVCITLLAIFLRLYQLGKVPISLEWDEVAIGYDAYSIIATGRDQFGKLLPINFRSLDDYKPPLYVYMAIPSIMIFGLTEFAVRFPSAVFGVIAVILTYLLVLELFKYRSRSEKHFIALIAALFLAISPWHLQFSRAVFETNLSVTVNILAVLLFLKGISGDKRFFLASSAFFGLSFFSYHSTRIVTPLILAFLLMVFYKQLHSKKILLGFFAIYLVFITFFIPIALSKDAQIRFLVTNDLNIAQTQTESAKAILQDSKIGMEFSAKVFHNRRLAMFNYENFQKIVSNYFSHFSPIFLFVEGDAPLHHAPGFGMMYFFEAPLLIFGFLSYFFYFRDRRSLILPFWLIMAPLPAAVTWQAPHSVRAEIILPTLQIFCALGLVRLLFLLRKETRVFYYLPLFMMIPFFLYGVGKYLHQYYVHTNYELSKNWIYGRKEAVAFTEKEKEKYEKVLVSLNVDMPHIFWLFYTKYSPKDYLSSGGTVSGGFADERNRFDKYEFRNFKYSELSKDKKYLLVGTPVDFPAGTNIIKTIYHLDGSKALLIAENIR